MDPETVVVTDPAETANPDLTNQDSQDGGNQGSDGGEDVSYKKRYEDSSREGKKNYELRVKAEARLEALERELESARSLKAQSQQQEQANQAMQFVPEESFVQLWTEKGMPEEAARLMYKDRKFQHEQTQYLIIQNQALQNRIRFADENASKLAAETNPEAKAAAAFCKDFPELASLPIADQIARHRSFQEKMGVKASGRDLSAVKAAAGGGSPGGGSPGSAAASSTSFDELARQSGFPSYKAMEEYSKVSTDEDQKAFQRKYPNWKPS